MKRKKRDLSWCRAHGLRNGSIELALANVISAMTWVTTCCCVIALLVYLLVTSLTICLMRRTNAFGVRVRSYTYLLFNMYKK